MQVYGLCMPITENGSLLFSSCHLELVISEIVNFLLVTTRDTTTNNEQKTDIVERFGEFTNQFSAI